MNILKKITGIITDDPREQYNLCCYGGAAITRDAYLPLLQMGMPFYLAIGLTTTQIGILRTPGLVVSVCTMILSTAFLDRIRKRALFCGMIQLLSTLPGVTLVLLISLLPFLQKPELAFYIFFAVNGIGAFFAANDGAVDAMLFSRSIKPDHRGKFFGLAGIIGGLIGLGFSALASYELKALGYPRAFTVIYGLALVLVVVAAMLKCRTREIPELVGSNAPQKTPVWENLKKIFRMKEFALLMPANIMRGFGDGAGGYAVVVGMRDIGLPIEVAGYTIMLSSLSSLTANAAIGKFADRIGAGRMILPTVVLLCAGLIGMVNSTSTWVFLGFYLLWYVMMLMESTEIPLVHYDVLPVEVMGAFSNIRLLCLKLTASLSGIMVGIFLDHFAPWVVFAVCACLKLVSALLFTCGSEMALRHKRRLAAGSQNSGE